jgi:hypothetical protein
MNNSSEIYQSYPARIFETEFRNLYEAIWDAERIFDLIFRQDRGVYVWAANRVRFYYELATGLGLYSPQNRNTAGPTTEPRELLLTDLPQVDVYIQTGATGPATQNRSRPMGCVYTERYVKIALEKGLTVLLLHDAPEKLVKHTNLIALTSRELANFSKQTRTKFPEPDTCRIDDDAAMFWGEVDDFFQHRLGVHLLDRARIDTLLLSFQRQLATQTQVFQQCRPRAFIFMAHYFRAAQVEAAKSVGARTVDFQHGINSKYHLGYGFPNIKAEHRLIPYFPDEFWSWGEFWTDRAWFPTACTDIRNIGHYEGARAAHGVCKTRAQRKKVLLATSWAMQNDFRRAATTLAENLPECDIVIKLHPRESSADYADIAKSSGNVTVLSGDTDIMDASATADIVISICSSSLFDVLLNGCKIIVLNAPAIEYVEDFVSRYKISILEIDGSNLRECFSSIEGQALPLSEIFSDASSQRISLAIDSVSSPLRIKTSSRKPVNRKPKTPLQARIDGCVSYLVNRLGEKDCLMRRKRVAIWHEPILRRYRDAFAGHGYKMARAGFTEALKADEPERLARLVLDLLELGMSSKGLRRPFLDAIWRLERTGHARTAQRLIARYIQLVILDELPLNLPVFEHAIRCKADRCLLARFGAARQARRWREGAELLASQNRLASRMCEVIEVFVTEASEEFFDTRVGQCDQKRLFRHLERRLEQGVPFAMMRLGDGEAYGLDPSFVDKPVLEADRARREKVWWGVEQSGELRARLRREFLDSLRSIDLLGIPSSFRLLRDIPPFLDELCCPIESWHHTPRAHYVLMMELDRLRWEGVFSLINTVLIDERCHQDLFTPEKMAILLSPHRHVVAVSCFRADQLNAALGASLIDDHVLLPPHAKVRDVAPDSAVFAAPTPHLLDELLEEIDSRVRPGSVVLVAGGFVGKILIARARAAGGMVLDIGASPDYWMGLTTRGAFDFGAYNKTSEATS